MKILLQTRPRLAWPAQGSDGLSPVSLLDLRLVGILLWLLSAGTVRAQAPNVTYSPPLEITHGGTYTGNFKSMDSTKPCIKIRTAEPVILDHCILAGAGALIQADSTQHHITVRYCQGYGLVPSLDNRPRGRFLDVVQARAIHVEHNYLENTAGIYLYEWRGDGTADNTLTVVANEARNLDGRSTNGGSSFVSFLQLNQVHALVGAEVAWNRVVNLPNQSLVEDNINFYNSGGTAQSPVRVHDNYIYGSFAVGDLSTIQVHTGTRINCDGDAPTAAEATQYILAEYNVVVATTNAGMNIASGHHNTYRNNRVVSAAEAVVDGQPVRVRAAYAGMNVFLYYSVQGSFFGNHVVEGNVIGYINGQSMLRNDVSNDPTGNTYRPDPALQTALPDPITRATEENELTMWNNRAAAAGVTVGPQSPGLRAPENPAGTVNGLAYQYYEGSWNVIPDFTSLTPTQSGTTTSLDLSAVAQRDYGYAIHYTGFVTVPTNGQYTFATSSDDGSRLYIGSQLVVDNDGLHPTQERTGTIGLQAGTHAFTLDFLQNGGGQSLAVTYQLPGQAPQALPPSALQRPSLATYAVVYRIHAGGNELTTSQGTFAADGYVAGGAPYSTSQAIAGTADPALYQTERYGDCTYSFPVSNGSYQAVLHFAEIYWTQPGQRVFNVGLEGSVRLNNYDIVAKAGALTATTETLPVTVTDGSLDIQFTSLVDMAKVSAIEILQGTTSTSRVATQALAAAVAAPAQASLASCSVYPNPTVGPVSVRTANLSPLTHHLEATLTDAVGHVVRRFAFAASHGTAQTDLSTAGLTPGIYWLRLALQDEQGNVLGGLPTQRLGVR